MPTTETIQAPGISFRDKLKLGAMMACKPCGCGSGGGGTEGCTQCNECNWFNGAGSAPTSFNLLAHSPSAGFADFNITLTYLAPNTPGWHLYGGMNFGDVPYYGVCYPDWDGDGLGVDYYAVGVYRGTLSEEWDFPGADVAWVDCESGIPAGVSGTTTKILAYAQLVNYVYKVGEEQCYSWLLAVDFTDYRSPPVGQGATISGTTIAGVDCDSAHTVKAANMVVECTGSPYYFFAEGIINCREDNADCDGSYEYGVTLDSFLPGETYELTLT